jgi:hypothetical protein
MQAIGQDGAEMRQVVSLRGLGVAAPGEAIIGALCEGLERNRDVRWIETGLNAREQNIAQRLHEQKYQSCEWNRQGLDVPANVPAPTSHAS